MQKQKLLFDAVETVKLFYHNADQKKKIPPFLRSNVAMMFPAAASS